MIARHLLTGISAFTMMIVLMICSNSCLADEQATTQAKPKKRQPPRTKAERLARIREKINHKPIWVNPGRNTKNVKHSVLYSKAMKHDVGYLVLLPPDYDDNVDRRYPVIYILHGAGGNELKVLERNLDKPKELGRENFFLNAIKAGEIPPMIFVFPNADIRSWYCDYPEGSIMAETHIIKELIPHIDATYRTIACRAGRGIEGFSMGGFGAIKLAFQHPDMFASAISYIGHFGGLSSQVRNFNIVWADDEKTGTKSATHYKMDSEGLKKNSPYELARTNAEKIHGKMAIKLVAGGEDKSCTPTSVKMCTLLSKLRIPHELVILPGVAHQSGLSYKFEGLKGLKLHAEAFGKATAKANAVNHEEKSCSQ